MPGETPTTRIRDLQSGAQTSVATDRYDLKIPNKLGSSRFVEKR